jgi:outer membrane protein TolC
VAIAEEHHDQLQALYRADLAVEADVSQAEAHLAAARSGVARAGAGVAVAEAALATLLGLDVQGGFAVAESLTDVGGPPAQLTPEALEEAYASRPELRALEGLLTVQRRSERAASGGYWPHLALVAGADYASPNPRVIPPQDEFSPSWEVGALLSWSPSDTTRASAAVRRVRAMQAAAEADLESLRDGVRLQAIRAREELLAAQAVMEASLARVDAAERAYESRAAALGAGEGVPSDVLDADIEVTRARLEVLRAGVDARIAEARLRHALGRLDAD